MTDQEKIQRVLEIIKETLANDPVPGLAMSALIQIRTFLTEQEGTNNG